jgi:NADPH:quinone reductase-like Zn-dependent oxidoreductase
MNVSAQREGAQQEPLGRTMQAVLIRGYGGPQTLEVVRDASIPRAGPGQVLVRVHASGLNPADAFIRAGRMKLFTGRDFPKVLGCDIAGEVVQAAEGFAAGERVFAMLDTLKGGGYAEYAAVPAGFLARMPQALSFEEAAAVPLAALTAWQGLRDVARVQRGQRVLVRGASGGVGGYAVQLARGLGAHVTGLCSERNVEWVRALGAEEVIDYGRTKLADMAGGHDVVFDAAGEDAPWGALRRLLQPRGVYVGIRPSFPGMLRQAVSRFMPGPAYRLLLVKPSGAQLAELAARMDAGSVRSTLARTLSPAELVSAHEELERLHTRGKWVVRWSGPGA